MSTDEFELSQESPLIQPVRQSNTDQARQVQAHTAQLQQALQTAQARIIELERLNRLKDDSLNTFFHEMQSAVSNTNLTIQMLEKRLRQGIMTYGETVQLNADFTSCFSYLQILKDECEREFELVNYFLNLQQIEAGEQPLEQIEIRLQDWIPYVVEPFEVRTRARQQSLLITLPPDLPPLVSDPSRLRRTLAELLNNACKYTPPGGSIYLSVTMKLGLFQLQVCNNGVEIPTQELTHIFDKFYRIPSGDRWGQGGSGLGLALVKELVNRLAGSIRVESKAGQTCFTVELPSNPAKKVF